MIRLSLLTTAMITATIALAPQAARASVDPATTMTRTLDLTGLDLSRSADWNTARKRVLDDAASICHALNVQAGDSNPVEEAACIRDSEATALRNLADLRDSSPTVASDLTAPHLTIAHPVLAAINTPHG